MARIAERAPQAEHARLAVLLTIVLLATAACERKSSLYLEPGKRGVPPRAAAPITANKPKAPLSPTERVAESDRSDPVQTRHLQ